MTNRIPSKLLLGHEINLDEQIHVNHHGCPAGTDTRERLYIKRVGIDAYVGHCFNCGGSGYHFGDGIARAEDLVGNRRVVPVYGGNLYKEGIDELPPHVIKYLADYRISKEEAHALHYKYHKKRDRLLMPFLQGRARPFTAYQGRAMWKEAVPRYITFRKSTDPTYSAILFPVNLVIVEDQISAYRLHRESKGSLSVVALLGTNMGNDCKEILTKLILNRVTIWLDNDTAGQTAASRLSMELKPLLTAKVQVMYSEQPKDLSVTQLEYLIEKIKAGV